METKTNTGPIPANLFSNMKVQTPLSLEAVPIKLENEEPMTDKQLKYICHMSGCAPDAIRHLGKWQASWLIDSLVEQRYNAENDDEDGGQIKAPIPQSRNGCGQRTLLLLIILGFTIYYFFVRSNDSEESPPKTTQPAEITLVEKRAGTNAAINTLPANELETAGPTALPDATKDPAQESDQLDSARPVLTFTDIELPATFLVLEDIEMLDPAGKEIVIPSKTLIEVVARKPAGTLTINALAETYVGNESRLIGKVRTTEK